MQNQRRKGGFTLIELIVVLVIMAVLAAAALPAMMKYIGQAKETTALNEAGVVVRAAKAETVALAAAGSIQEWKSADKKAEVVSSVGLEGEIKQVEISAAGILTGLYYEASNGVIVSYQAQRSPTLQVEKEVPSGGDVIGGNSGPVQTVEEWYDRTKEVLADTAATMGNTIPREKVIQDAYKANGGTLLQTKADLAEGTDWYQGLTDNRKKTEVPLYWRPYVVGTAQECKDGKGEIMLYATTGNGDGTGNWGAVLIYWQGTYYQCTNTSAYGARGSVANWPNNVSVSQITDKILANGFVVYQTGAAPT